MSSAVDYLLQRNIEYQVPFCKPFVCSNASQSNSLTNGTGQTFLWHCMPASCKTKLIGFITVIVLLSFFTTIFNAAVFVINLTPSTRRIFRRNPTMRNYSNYVISLSFTDFLVGAVVLPLAVAFFCQEMFILRGKKEFRVQESSDFSQQNMLIVSSDSISNTTQVAIPSNLTSTADQSSFFFEGFESKPESEKSNTLICVLGFFTQLCVFVSMYTLTAASVDRFYVSKKATGNPTIRLSR